MSVEEKLNIQCECGFNFKYTGEAIYTSPLKYLYRCESCVHEIYIIKKEESIDYNDYDSHMEYKS